MLGPPLVSGSAEGVLLAILRRGRRVPPRGSGHFSQLQAVLQLPVVGPHPRERQGRRLLRARSAGRNPGRCRRKWRGGRSPPLRDKAASRSWQLSAWSRVVKAQPFSTTRRIPSKSGRSRHSSASQCAASMIACSISPAPSPNPDAAVMLLVTLLEAPIVPRPFWGRDKVTKRFINAIDELCPEVVGSLVNHANVEQAFVIQLRRNPRRRRRKLLNAIYTMRSNPTHSGVRPSARYGFLQLADSGGIRVALLSDLARKVLLPYLVARRSSLIGHPLIDPPGAAQSPTAT